MPTNTQEKNFSKKQQSSKAPQLTGILNTGPRDEDEVLRQDKLDNLFLKKGRPPKIPLFQGLLWTTTAVGQGTTFQVEFKK